MKTYTVEDPTGRQVTFDWELPTEPTDNDFEEVFKAAKTFKPTELNIWSPENILSVDQDQYPKSAGILGTVKPIEQKTSVPTQPVSMPQFQPTPAASTNVAPTPPPITAETKVPMAEMAPSRVLGKTRKTPEEIATPQYRQATPEEVARDEYARNKTNELEEISGLFARGIAEGLTTELPGQIGGAVKFVGAKTGIEPVETVGKNIQEFSEKTQKELYGEKPKVSGINRAVYEGAKMLAPSLIPGLASTTAFRGLLGVSKAIKLAKATGAAEDILRATKLAKSAAKLGSASSAVSVYGLSQAQQTIDSAEKTAQELEAKGDVAGAERARKAAKGFAPYFTGAIEAAGEYLGTKYLGKLFGLSEFGVVKKGTAGLAKDIIKTLGVEIGTETGQTAGEAATEKYSGIRPTADILDETLSVIGPTAFMTLLTGGLAAGSRLGNGKETNLLPSAPPSPTVQAQPNQPTPTPPLAKPPETVVGGVATQPAQVTPPSETDLARGQEIAAQHGLEFKQAIPTPNQKTMLKFTDPVTGKEITLPVNASTERIQNQTADTRKTDFDGAAKHMATQAGVEYTGKKDPRFVYRVYKNGKLEQGPAPWYKTPAGFRFTIGINATVDQIRESAARADALKTKPTTPGKEMPNEEKRQGQTETLLKPPETGETIKPGGTTTEQPLLAPTPGYKYRQVRRPSPHMDKLLREYVESGDDSNPEVTGLTADIIQVVDSVPEKTIANALGITEVEAKKGIVDVKTNKASPEGSKIRSIIGAPIFFGEKVSESIDSFKEKPATAEEGIPLDETGQPMFQRKEPVKTKQEELFTGTQFEDNRTEPQKAADKFLADRENRRRENITEGLPLFDKNTQEEMATKQEKLAFQRKKDEEMTPEEYNRMREEERNAKKAAELQLGEGPEYFEVTPEIKQLREDHNKLIDFFEKNGYIYSQEEVGWIPATPEKAKQHWDEVKKGWQQVLPSEEEDQYARKLEETSSRLGGNVEKNEPATGRKRRTDIQPNERGEEARGERERPKTEERVEENVQPEEKPVSENQGQRTGPAHPVQEAAGLAKARDQAPAEGLKKALSERDNVDYSDEDIHIVEPANEELLAVKKAIEVTSGKPVYFLQMSDRIITSFNGVNYHGKIFIDANSRNPILSTGFHEALEQLYKNDPAAFKKALVISKLLMTDEGHAKVAERAKREGIDLDTAYKEYLFDFGGDVMSQKEFWLELQDKEPGVFKKIVSYLIQTLNKYLRNPSDQFKSGQIYKDAVAVRKALIETYANFGKNSEEDINAVIDAIGFQRKPNETYHEISQKLDKAYQENAPQKEIDQLETELAELISEEDIVSGNIPATSEGISLEEELARMYVRYIDPKERHGMEKGDILENMRDAVISRGGKQDITNNQILAAAEDSYLNRPMFQRKSPPGTYDIEMEDQSRSDAFRQFWQDKYIRLRRLMEASGEKLEKLPDELNSYYKQELINSKVSDKINTFQKDYIDKILDVANQNKLDINQTNDYLYAKHAKERNDLIAKRRPDMVEKGIAGSGMTNEQAKAILDAAEKSGKKDALEEISKTIQDWNTAKLQMMVDDGILTPQQKTDLQNEFKYYVPLKGIGEKGKKRYPRTGKGYNVTGREFAMARGRMSKAQDIIANLVADTTEKIVRGEKNKVIRSLYEFSKKFKNNLIVTEPVAIEKQFDKTTGEFKDIRKTRFSDNDIQRYGLPINFKIDGESMQMLIKDEPLQRAMRNLGSLSSGIFEKAIVKYIMPVMRYLSMIRTQLSLNFIPSNFMRDTLTAQLNTLGLNLSAENKKGLSGDILRGMFPAMKAAYEGQSGKNTRGASQYDDFVKAGGAVDFFGLKDVESIQKSLINQLNNMKPGVMAQTKRLGKTAFDYISLLNGAIENANRLSTYLALTKRGISKQKAAYIAKNLTVNFNKKGEAGTFLNAWQIFANASLQGSVRILQALKTSKKLQAICGGIILTSLAHAELMRLIAGDDPDDEENYYDKISNFLKNTHIILPLGKLGEKEKKNYIRIPLPYGYNVFWAFGQILSKMTHAKHKKDAIPEAALESIGTIANAYNPIGGSFDMTNAKSTMRSLVPTIAQPLAEIAINQNFMDQPVYKEQPKGFGSQPVESHSKLKNTPESLAKATEWLNDFTGGGKYRAGKINLSPDIINHLWQFGTGGVGSVAKDIVNAPYEWISNKKAPLKSIPLVQRFYGEINEYKDVKAFYDNIDKAQRIYNDYETSKKKNPEEAIKLRKQYPMIINLFSKKEGEITTKEGATRTGEFIPFNKSALKPLTHLNEIRKRFDRADKKDMVEKIDEKIINHAQRWNKILDKAFNNPIKNKKIEIPLTKENKESNLEETNDTTSKE